jgi:hypothetical protein
VQRFPNHPELPSTATVLPLARLIAVASLVNLAQRRAWHLLCRLIGDLSPVVGTSRVLAAAA